MAVEILKELGERIGLIETPEQREAVMRSARESLRTTIILDVEWERDKHRYLFHSDACPSKIDYVLGTSDYDPHPHRPVRLSECECPEYTDEAVKRRVSERLSRIDPTS